MRIRILCVAASCLLTQFAFADKPIDVQTVLRNWEAAHQLVSTDISYECELHFPSSGDPTIERIERKRVIKRADGSFDVTATREKDYSDPAANQVPPGTYQVRWLRIEGLKPFSNMIILTADDGPEVQAANAPPGQVSHSTEFGNFEIFSEVSAPTYLLKNGRAELRPARERVNDTDCHVIDARTEFGTFVFWIDSDHGWNMAKAQGHRQKGDRVRNGYTKLPHAYPDRTNGGVQPELIAEDREEACESFAQVNGGWIVEKMTTRLVHHFADGSARESWNKAQRWDVNLKPDFEELGAFKIDLPDGTTVSVGAQQDFKFEWHDGTVKAVAK